ncbi:hypothetical protein FC697_22480 [Bacillus wiedmannii]|uniref:hypothetical protein n=1 Tax=Bacillus wiedmannii TaxID=1890302 RepID=UPI0010BD391D|nr:hypothetical protein [Bacillus wiedmannii]TKH17158.1 hypothetical protein FC697_22480 [Bacillus wiedmannii]
MRNIPFRDGMDLGLGIDDLTGSVGSLPAVNFTEIEEAVGEEGMEAVYDTSLVNSSEQMYHSLGIDVNAEGRYGLFTAEGKFSFAEKSQFNSTSTFLVARADIQNAFKRVKNPSPTQDAQDLKRDGDTETFRKRYGDLFIRGVKSGGEYIAILSITNKVQQDQRDLGIALKASFDSIVAGGSLSVAIQEKISRLKSNSEVRVSIYQRGGVREQISYTGTVEEVMERIKTFATVVNQNPKAYSVQTASYDTLIFPDGPNPFDIRRQQEVLEDCMKKRLQLQTIRNDIEMILLHPDYFKSPPDRATLSMWSTAVTSILNELDRHVDKVIDSISAAEFYPLTLPEGLVLPERVQHSSTKVEIFTLADYSLNEGGVPGRSQKLAPGWYDDAKSQILIGNDQLSSIKVPEGLAVRAWEHAWFQGAFIDFTEDTPALPMNWNDRISSLVVYPAEDRPPKISQVVAIESLWSPRWLVLNPGKYPDLTTTPLGRATTSALLIPQGMIVRMWDQPNFQGNSIEFYTDTLELPPDWNNRAASFEVLDTREG